MDEALRVEGNRTRIYWIGGSKGGVGKSMMTPATVDDLIEYGQNVVLVECDTSNPDLWTAYKDLLATELIHLDESDGWIQLVNASLESTMAIRSAFASGPVEGAQRDHRPRPRRTQTGAEPGARWSAIDHQSVTAPLVDC